MGKKRQGKNFIVEIKSREHHTWQGNITWIEGQQKESFRSALELLKLIDSALEEQEEK